MPRIDLHMHTTCSDGSLSPAELVDKAHALGLKAIAVTDHDEICGCKEAMERGREKGIDVVAGVELSIDYPLSGKNHLHIVGLFIDIENKQLKTALEKLKMARRTRAEKMVSKLRKAGYNVTYEELKKISGEGSIGRPHVAALLKLKGIIRKETDAFRHLLSKGGPGYVSKEKLDVKSAIDVLHRAGGLAIMAHPISLGFRTYDELGKEILKIRDYGLDGIEAYYSRHDRYLTRWLLEFADKNDLLISGGSDFHGTAKPNVQPGIGSGDLHIPYSVYENLLNFRKKNIAEK